MTTTQGIIINHIKHKETSIITKVYTKHQGLKSFITHDTRMNKTRFNIANIRPLSIVEVVMYNNSKRRLQYLKELKSDFCFNTMHTDIEKGLIILIISDILAKTIREDIIYENLYEFLIDKIRKLNESKEIDILNFLLVFIIKFCLYLGFGINDNEEFAHQLSIIGPLYKLNILEENLLLNLLSDNHNEEYTSYTAFSLLKKFVAYLGMYYPSIKHLKSLNILAEVMAFKN